MLKFYLAILNKIDAAEYNKNSLSWQVVSSKQYAQENYER